jgi:hypothetical protein
LRVFNALNLEDFDLQGLKIEELVSICRLFNQLSNEDLQALNDNFSFCDFNEDEIQSQIEQIFNRIQAVIEQKESLFYILEEKINPLKLGVYAEKIANVFTSFFWEEFYNIHSALSQLDHIFLEEIQHLENMMERIYSYFPEEEEGQKTNCSLSQIYETTKPIHSLLILGASALAFSAWWHSDAQNEEDEEEQEFDILGAAKSLAFILPLLVNTGFGLSYSLPSALQFFNNSWGSDKYLQGIENLLEEAFETLLSSLEANQSDEEMTQKYEDAGTIFRNLKETSIQLLKRMDSHNISEEQLEIHENVGYLGQLLSSLYLGQEENVLRKLECDNYGPVIILE